MPISLYTITRKTILQVTVEKLPVFSGGEISIYWYAKDYPEIFKALTLDEEIAEIKKALLDFLTAPSSLKTQLENIKSSGFFTQLIEASKSASSDEKKSSSTTGSIELSLPLRSSLTKEELEKAPELPLTSVEYATKIIDGIFNYGMPLEETLKYALVDQQKFSESYESSRCFTENQGNRGKYYFTNLPGYTPRLIAQMNKLQQNAITQNSNRFFASGTNPSNAISDNTTSSSSCSSSSTLSSLVANSSILSNDASNNAISSNFTSSSSSSSSSSMDSSNSITANTNNTPPISNLTHDSSNDNSAMEDENQNNINNSCKRKLSR